MYDAVLDDQYLGLRNRQGRLTITAQQNYDRGAALAADALASPDGSAPCEELRIAIGAAAVTASGFRTLAAEYRWWKAVIQGRPPRQRRNRRGQNSIRYGDTDFSDHF